MDNLVKIPVGKIVEVDLWNTQKKHGLVKYHSHTMDLVRAESEFELKKGDLAIVIESSGSFAKLIPKDEFIDVFKGFPFRNIDYSRLNRLIYRILKDMEAENGGILLLNDIYSQLKNTSIRDAIKLKHLQKAIGMKDISYNTLEEDGEIFLLLKPIDCPLDEKTIIKYALNFEFVTIDSLQNETNWTTLRIRRILEHLLKLGRCRKDSSYLKGERYYF